MSSDVAAHYLVVFRKEARGELGIVFRIYLSQNKQGAPMGRAYPLPASKLSTVGSQSPNIRVLQ